jgi:drug/metabolite transporter (DMT)-like permease
MATMRTTAAAIAPIVYIQLLIATGISVFVFGDPIDRTAILGSLLIIFSGLLLWRGVRRANTVLEA